MPDHKKSARTAGKGEAVAAERSTAPQSREPSRRGRSTGSVKIGLRGSVVRNPEQREEQRRQILAAAGRVFARKGYEASKMDDIAAEMGVSKGILYYQFQSKQDVIVETRRLASGQAARRLEEIVALVLPAPERLELAVRDLIETNFDELSRHVILTPVTIGLDKANVEKVREIERRYEALLIGLLSEGMAEGSFVAADPRVTAFTVIRTAMSPAFWFREGGGIGREETIGIVSCMLMRGVLAGDGASTSAAP